MKTSDRILQTIKRGGAITAKQLADQLDMTTMGARQHLQSLENEDLLRFEDVRVKIGRPTRYWSLTAKGHAQFSDHHGDLIVQLLDSVESVYGPSGVERILSDREQKTFHNYRVQLEPFASLQEKLAKLVALREADGYMAELLVTETGFLIIENHCPICKAASRTPSLCQSELSIFRELLSGLGDVKRVEHILQRHEHEYEHDDLRPYLHQNQAQNQDQNKNPDQAQKKRQRRCAYQVIPRI
ncbi:transcriptional regulator [Vibrio sinensis]|uniref:Transcriptional regulator n=1 Tax=Vibrio sinensis TaxID=2302434 RepID=A0A3A6R7A6_9VIBR|nr:transcriptional regulator [Vibrio sinensis]